MARHIESAEVTVVALDAVTLRCQKIGPGVAKWLLLCGSRMQEKIERDVMLLTCFGTTAGGDCSDAPINEAIYIKE